MAQGEFLWCDLATFDVVTTLDYYRRLFQWEVKTEDFNDNSVYYYVSSSKDVTAGVYEMPQEFKDQNMPSFWMSYIGVDDVVESLKLVEKLGGTLILGPATFGNGAKIAMVEDPTGARFTLFSGTYLQPRSTEMIPGAHFWNELYTSDPEKSAAFYSELFGWAIESDHEDGNWRVNNLAGRLTTAFQDCSKAIEPLNVPQWTVCFAVEDLETFVMESFSGADGEAKWTRNANGAALCLKDPNGAIFLVSDFNSRNTRFP